MLPPSSSDAAGGPARRAPGRRDVLGTVARALLVVLVTSLWYALAPLDRSPTWGLAARLVLWLSALAALYAWQIRSVMRSAHPALRATEAAAVGLPAFVLLFAAMHVVTAQSDPASYSEPLTRVDGLYLAVTVFATVGFGDIVPLTDAARLLVTAQMLAGLLLVGLVAKVLFGAVQHRQRALLPGEAGPAPRPVPADDRAGTG